MKKTNTLKKVIKPALVQIKKIGNAWSGSKVGTMGASVAFYTIFSLAPLLVIAISLTSIFVSQDTAQAGIISEFRGTFGESGAELVQSLIQSKESTETSIVLSIISFIILLVGATGIFSQLQSGLDTIFESLPEKRKKGIWGIIAQKLLSFGMVMSFGFLLLVSLALSAFVTAASRYLAQFTPGVEALAHIVELTISLILISFFLALTYKILPSKRLQWKPALIGGLIAGVLFTISKYALGLYLGSSESLTSYGAASSLVLLIMWTYYMSQVFFFGAILLRLYIVPKVK